MSLAPETESAVAISRANWKDYAECLGHGEQMQPAASGRGRPGKNGVVRNEAEEYAISEFCSNCPVVSLCLEYALEQKESYGIWGGTTEYERRKLIKARGSAPKELGTAEPSNVIELPQQRRSNTLETEINKPQRTLPEGYGEVTVRFVDPTVLKQPTFINSPIRKPEKINHNTPLATPVLKAERKPQIGIERARLILELGSIAAQKRAKQVTLQKLKEAVAETGLEPFRQQDTLLRREIRRLSKEYKTLGEQVTFDQEA